MTSKRSRNSRRRKKSRKSKRNSRNNPCGPGRILRRGYVRRASLRSLAKDDDDMTRVRRTVVPAKCIRDRGPVGRPKKLIIPEVSTFLQEYYYDQLDSTRKRHNALKRAVRDAGYAAVYKQLRAFNSLQEKNTDEYDNVQDDLIFLREMKRRQSRGD